MINDNLIYYKINIYRKNKEDIIKDIYLHISVNFEGFEIFNKILDSKNPLKVLSDIFDLYGDLFWQYRFLMRDMLSLISIYLDLKEIFVEKQ